MSMTDPIADMLTRIRNAQMRGKSTVETPASKQRARVLDVLADEGYIRGYEETTDKNGHPAIEISLRSCSAAISRRWAAPRATSAKVPGQPPPASPTRRYSMLQVATPSPASASASADM